MGLYDLEESLGLHSDALLNLAENHNQDIAAHAERKRLQQSTGTPAVLMDDPEVLADAQKQAYMQGLALSHAPATKSFAEDPNNAPLMAKDIHNLTSFEDRIAKLPKLPKSTLGIATHQDQEFAKKFVNGRTVGDLAMDTGITAVKGVINLYEAGVGLSDMPTFGYTGKMLQSIGLDSKQWHAVLDEYYSDPQKQANKAVNDAQGVGETFQAAMGNPSTIFNSIVQSLPSIYGGGVVGGRLMGVGAKTLGRGMAGPIKPGVLTRLLGEYAPVVAGAVGEGTISAGSNAEQVRQDSANGLLDTKGVLSSGSAGLGTTLFSLFGGAVAKKLGIADIDTLMVTNGHAPSTNKALGRRVLESMISEGVLEELPQSMWEQMMQNYGSGNPLWEGVGKSGVLGMLAGMAMGGGGTVMSRTDAHTEHNTQLVSALTNAEGSRLLQDSPETFAEFAQRVGEHHNVPYVYFQSDRLIDEAVKQGITEDKIPGWLAQYGVDGSQIVEALHTGGLFQMDFGKVAANFKNDGVMQALQNDFLVDPNARTLSDTENGSQVDAAHLDRLDEIYAAEQEKLVGKDDLYAWKQDILSRPELSLVIKEEHLDLMAARANALAKLTGVPAIEHMNAMLKPSGVQTMKFKEWQAKKQSGQVLGQSQVDTATPEFKNWFGGSKVVDGGGQPLVVYHGTAKDGYVDTTDIQAFDKTRTGDRWNADSRGFFFTNDHKISDYYSKSDRDYSDPGAGNGAVYPVYLSIKKPLEIVIPKSEDVVSYWDNNSQKIQDKAAKGGHDGVILIDKTQKVGSEYVKSIVAFEPTQIKSVFNSGAFDPNNPNILLQSSPSGVSLIQEVNNNARLNNTTGEPGRRGKSQAGTFKAAQDVAGRVYLASENDARTGEVRSAESEQLRAFAEQNGLMLDATPMQQEVDKQGISGTDNYVFAEDGAFFKVNKFKHAETFTDLFSNIDLHNQVFPTAKYIFEGFTDMQGELRPVFSQSAVKNKLTKENERKQIEQLAADELVRRGFTRVDAEFPFVSTAKFTKGDIVIRDINYKNVAYQDGEVIFFDPVVEIDKSKRTRENMNALFQTQQERYYAALTQDNGQNLITLFENADKSSFLHEAGHIFLNDLKRVAEQYGVQTAEWQAAKEWLGIGDDGVITREQHEKFAEHWEVYLNEGRAPNAEMRDAFRSFKKWLTAIYRSVKSGRFGQREGITITPEIRDLFDRLIEIGRAHV